jgi:hypothetical protein
MSQWRFRAISQKTPSGMTPVEVDIEVEGATESLQHCPRPCFPRSRPPRAPRRNVKIARSARSSARVTSRGCGRGGKCAPGFGSTRREGGHPRGRPIGPLDTLIAAQAVARKLTLVSNNRKEFGRVPRLAIENWADRA